MQWDLVLIAKCVRSKNRGRIYRDLKSLGLSERLFSPLLKPVWHWIREQEITGKGLPTEPMLTAKFPGLRFPDVPSFHRVVDEDSPEEIVNLLRERNMSAIGQEAGHKMVHLAETDPTQIPELLTQVRKDILSTIPVPSVTTVGADLDEDLLEYEAFSNPKGAGLIFPYEDLVSSGLGFNPSGIYCIYGSPGKKKTWFMLWLALWYWKRGFRVLFLTQEMYWERLKWRAYALHGGFNWNTLVAGKINKEELREVISDFGQTKNFYVRDPISAGDCRPVIDGIIASFEPDIIFDDSSYLRSLTVGRESGTIRGSSYLAGEWVSHMKRTANSNRVPYFFTWQPNDQGEMYMTRTGAQDCELILKIDGPNDGVTSDIEVRKNREGTSSTGIKIQSGLCKDFGRVAMDIRDAVKRAGAMHGNVVRLSDVRDSEPS